MATFNIEPKPWIQCFVYAAHSVVYCLHLVVYNSVSQQTPTRGQDNTSVEVSGGERLAGSVAVVVGGPSSFASLEVLDLYPAAG